MDAKIIFEAGAFDKAEVNQDKEGSGYNLFLFKKNRDKEEDSVAIERQRGGVRVFKTIDAAASTAKNIGFNMIVIFI